MAKAAGFAANIHVADSAGASQDLSNDITDFTVSTSRGEQSITGLDKSAMERLLLLADGKVTVKGVYNSAANKSHAVFTGLIQSQSTGTNNTSATIIDLPPATAGAPRLTMNLSWYDFVYTRTPAGELTWQATGDLGDGTVPAWTTHP